MIINSGKKYFVFSVERHARLLEELKQRADRKDLLRLSLALASIAGLAFSPAEFFRGSDFFGVPAVWILRIVCVCVAFWFLHDLWCAAKVVFVSIDNVIDKYLLDVEEASLFVVVHSSGGEARVLAKRQEKWGVLFLPYTKDADVIAAAENMFRVKRDKIRLTMIKGCNVRDDVAYHVEEKVYKRFRFDMYHVEFSGVSHHSLLARLRRINKDYCWCLFDAFISGWSPVSRNPIVARLVAEEKELVTLNNSFDEDSCHDLSGGGGIEKIIWNVGECCEYGCGMCGTYRKYDGVAVEGVNEKILLELSALRGASIDFSGGDPLNGALYHALIRHAKDIFGSGKISITTTGRSVKQNFAFISEIRCELDLAHDYSGPGETEYRHKGYNAENTETVLLLRSNVDIKININIPLLPTVLSSNKNVDGLIKSIIGLDVNSVLLMRMMPTGRLIAYDGYEKYNPLGAVQSIRSALEAKGVVCKVHCAIRSQFEKNGVSSCTMLTKKIGVDCRGNVYACAWGGYIGMCDENNPFWLGNLQASTIRGIMSSDRAAKLEECLSGSVVHGCRLCSFLHEKRKSLAKGVQIGLEEGYELLCKDSDPLR